VDGIHFLSKGITQAAPILAATTPFLFSAAPEENVESYLSNKDEPAKEHMNIKVGSAIVSDASLNHFLW
jgi:hypothetical protein